MNGITTLRNGQLLVVRYGRDGEQLASFFRPVSYVGHHRIRVHKWLANSQRWTLPTTVETRDVLRVATEDDARKFRYAPKFSTAE